MTETLQEKKYMHPYLVGLIGIFGMTIFYVGILILSSGDPLHPWYFFLEKWYFLASMILGFGIQMWLFQRIRMQMHLNQGRMAVASAGVNGTAMVACCAHHLADVLPLLGFAGIASAVSAYQDVFLAVGVIITFVGIWYMSRRFIQVQRMHCTTADAT